MATPPSLNSRNAPLASPEEQRRILDELPLARDFRAAVAGSPLGGLTSGPLQTLQLNLGKLCNQTCRHCHVDAGPDRREVMSRETMELCLRVLEATPSLQTVDITGGAPELTPHFRWLVEECRRLGRHVMDRCNLTILETKPFEDLPAFFAQHQVEVVCSLPHYRALGTDAQRGEGVFAKSIAALKKLNALGYGNGVSGLKLVLVANPVGAFLPAGQAALEKEWKRELFKNHGIVFDALYTLTNMPISRYLEWLMETGNLQTYMERLVNAFNPATVEGLMCRNTLSVSWDGALFDCDFNQMLDLKVDAPGRPYLRDFDLDALAGRSIVTGPHCFGCTAGAGSSCGGATVA